MKGFFNPNGYTQPRKISGQNLESLFASLLHLISLSSAPYKEPLTGILGIIYNRILYLYNLDPISTISLLKLVSRWFIELIRRGDISRGEIPEDQWSEEHSCPELLVGLPDIWKTWWDKDTDKAKLSMRLFSNIIFSMLSCHRVIVVPVNPMHTSIDSPAPNKIVLPAQTEVAEALAYLGITSKEVSGVYANQVKAFNWEILQTQGPNGPSTFTAHLDARAWYEATTVLVQLKAFLQESNFMQVLKHLLGCIRVQTRELIPNLTPRLGKLAYIEEWGGKCRIVAQLDYWTQMALTPLHHTINHFLKRLTQDGTFDQLKVANQVKAWTATPGLEVYSNDLSNATDRLPISLQVMILEELFGSSSFAKAWKEILVGRNYITRNGDLISYCVGQPMGARSSFPMLALTHHVIIAIAAKRAGVQKYTSWVVLGDDSVILNKAVNAHYTAIMKELQVTINVSKSISHVPNALSAAEVCKRVFVSGFEVSAINPKILCNAIKDGRLGTDLQEDLTMRGFNMELTQFWTFMSAVLDRDNLSMLIKLNLVPTSISGITKVRPPETSLKDFEKWLPGVKLTSKDLIELFTFVTASESLKRLDAIFRSSADIIDTLRIMAASNANPKVITETIRNEWVKAVLNEERTKRVNEIFKGIGEITYNHPLLLAATAESNRLSELLHALNSLDTEMVNRARNGLLDTFRSSLGSIWEIGLPSRRQEVRAVFNKTLTVLASMWKRWDDMKEKPPTPSITYSVVISSISRLWNVHFTIGSVCSVNALRSSVTRSVVEAETNFTKVLDSLTILPGIKGKSPPSEDTPTVQDAESNTPD